MAAETDRPQVSDSGTTLELDAVVLGAGVAGLYQLREQGLAVRAFDAAGDVGGRDGGTATRAPGSTPRATSTTDRGDVVDTQFFITCGGMLSAPLTNQFAGRTTSPASSSTRRRTRRRASTSPESASAWSGSGRPGSR
jgi:flavin-dependent dehydrogenase